MQIDVGPVSMAAVYLPKTTDIQGNAATHSQWALDMQIAAAEATTSAPPGSTSHTLASIQTLFGPQLIEAAQETGCLWDIKKAAKAPYFAQLNKSPEDFKTWYDMCTENGISPPTPLKITKKGEGVPVVALKLKMVGKCFSKEKPVTFEGPTFDYAMSCPGAESSTEFQFFESNVGEHVVRVPWVRYTKEFGGDLVPAGRFRDVMDTVGPGSKVFVQGAFKSWINPNRNNEPFFRWEPQGMTIVQAVPRTGMGGAIAGVPVDYEAILSAKQVAVGGSDGDIKARPGSKSSRKRKSNGKDAKDAKATKTDRE